MFAASPSFLKMIRCDDDLIKMTILGEIVNFLESVGNLTSSTLFQFERMNQIKVNLNNNDEDDDDPYKEVLVS